MTYALALGLEDGEIGAFRLCPSVRFRRFRQGLLRRRQRALLEREEVAVDLNPMESLFWVRRRWILAL